MRLAGSCHCQRIRFELDTAWHYPYQGCCCEIRRKTNGSAFACNIKGRKADFRTPGAQNDTYPELSIDAFHERMGWLPGPD
ncbi:MAG: hypothetical protein ACOY4L_03910 [Pseudomonadota bacterium]